MNTGSITAVIQQKEAILFDLFHTLTARESTWSSGPTTSEMLGVSREAWNEQLLERSRERLTGEVKDPTVMVRKMAHAIDPTIPEEVIQATVRGRVERFARALTNLPEESHQVLRKLKGLNKKIGLISNADVSEITAWDRSCIAHWFDSVVFSCSVGYVKPEPEIYRICMRELGVEPYQCVFVGDGGSHELEGARSLGIATVMMTGVIKEMWPKRVDEERRHADYVIERLGQLVSDCE